MSTVKKIFDEQSIQPIPSGRELGRLYVAYAIERMQYRAGTRPLDKLTALDFTKWEEARIRMQQWSKPNQITIYYRYENLKLWLDEVVPEVRIRRLELEKVYLILMNELKGLLGALSALAMTSATAPHIVTNTTINASIAAGEDPPHLIEKDGRGVAILYPGAAHEGLEIINDAYAVFAPGFMEKFYPFSSYIGKTDKWKAAIDNKLDIFVSNYNQILTMQTIFEILGDKLDIPEMKEFETHLDIARNDMDDIEEQYNIIYKGVDSISIVSAEDKEKIKGLLIAMYPDWDEIRAKLHIITDEERKECANMIRTDLRSFSSSPDDFYKLAGVFE